MGAVSEPVGETVSAPLSTPWVSKRKQRDYSYLKPYQFKPKHAPTPGGGRPLGSKDALTVLLDAAPHKARQYVKSTAPAVLVDSRKWIMPIESDTPSNSVMLTRIEILAELSKRGVPVPPALAHVSTPS